VWSKIIAKQEVDVYKKAFNVISAKLVSGETQIRVLSDSRPEEGFKQVVAGLEDLYFATISSN
jgi:hypothetical protein